MARHNDGANNDDSGHRKALQGIMKGGIMVAGTTIATVSTAGTVAETVIARHDKCSRRTPKAGLYLYLPVCTTVAPEVRRKTSSLLYSDRPRSLREPASNRSKLKINIESPSLVR